MEDWKEEVMEKAKEIVAKQFNIEPEEDGEYDTSSYDWEAGCYCNGVWISPKEALRCMETFILENDYIFEEWYNG